MKKNSRGFTFLELLIAVVIFSIAAIAVYSSFAVGIRAWRRGESDYKIRQEARYAFDLISRELNNAINFRTIGFEGESDSVALVRALKVRNPDGSYTEGVYKITYTYDSQAQALYRILQTYEEAEKENTGVKSLLLSNISQFELSYSYLDVDKIIWKDSWEKEDWQLPLGVKIKLNYKLKEGEGSVEFSETVLVPIGTLRESSEGI